MKIGYICTHTTRQHYGISGVAVHIQEICRSLHKSGHEVFYIGGALAKTYESLKRYEVQPDSILPFARVRRNLRSIGSPVWRTLRPYERFSAREDLPAYPPDSSSNITTPSRSLRVLWNDIRTRVDTRDLDRYFYHRACRIIETEHPDVLYERFCLYCFSGVNLARRYKLPLILEMNSSGTFRGEWQYKHSPLYTPMIQRMEKKICQLADSVVVVDPFLKQYLVRLSIPEEKVFVIPNGVDLNRLYPDKSVGMSIKNKHDLNNKFLIGYVGSFRHYHDLYLLINSFRYILQECSKAHLLLVGDGPTRKVIESYVNDQGLTDVVTFTGNVSFWAVPAYINAMDVVVAPFARVSELPGSSIKIFEYMATAKPIVASRLQLTEQVISDHINGLLVELGNEHQMAQAILELLSDKGLRDQLGAEGRRLIEEKFTWERSSWKIIAIYEELLRSRKGNSIAA